MKLILVVSLCLLVGIVMSCSQNSGKKEYSIDPDLGFSTGPNINDKVPEFSLPDQNNNIKNLNELVGENGAILNFYRSASW